MRLPAPALSRGNSVPEQSKLYDHPTSKKKKFDPEGADYDYEGAKAAGLEAEIDPNDGLPHWPSRDPKTGTLLKGKKHKTFQKGVDADAELGYKLRKREDGRYETQKDE